VAIGGHELGQPVLAAIEIYKMDAQLELRREGCVRGPAA
jgi:hypothetical protein